MKRVQDFGWRWLQRRNIQFVSAMVLTAVVGFLAVSFATVRNGVTIFGTGLGADYAAFYVAGKILNEHSPTQLYDLGLQNQIYHSLMPDMSAAAWLPFRGYPPLVAVCFRPLARLPYAWSYLAWLTISAGLYFAGLALIWKTLRAIPSTERSTALLLALSFEPFLMESWAGGQLSVVGFFCFALALYCEDRRLPIAGGMALGLCLYKPTLLLLIVPLLLVGRRFGMLFGLCASALAQVAACLMSVGKRSCLQYVDMLAGHLRDATHSASVFADWKFVDLVSFVRLLSGGTSRVGRLAVLIVSSAAFLCLAMAWWRSKRCSTNAQRLLWASTLTGTLVVNVYMGIYDSVLVVIAALLTADVLYRRAGDVAMLPLSFKLWLVMLYVVPWFSQALARVTGFQLYTAVLAGFAAYQFALAGISRFRLQSRP